MLIVLDTNVLVSGMLKRNSKPALIMNGILEGKIQLAIQYPPTTRQAIE